MTNRNTATAATLFMMSTLIACAAAPQMVITTNKPLRPRRAPCEFELVFKRPPGDFEELSIIPQNEAGRSWHEYKEFTRGKVCKVGGDVVVATSNAFGFIIRGLVLRRI